MDEDEDASPFWLHTRRRNRRLRRQSSSLLFNSGFFIIFIVLLAFAFATIVLPRLVSFSTQVFRPQSVKKGWDSLNLVLVLFAIVCGFLSRNGSSDGAEDGRSPRSTGEYYNFSSTPKYGQLQRSSSSISGQLFDGSDRTPNNRMRSISSYPDLRQEYWSVNCGGGDGRWAFQDDTRLSGAYPVSSSDLLYHRHRREEQVEDRAGYYGNLREIGREDERRYYGNLNEIGIPEPTESNTVEAPPESSLSPPFDEREPKQNQPPSHPPPPPAPPQKAVRINPKRTFEDLPPPPQSESSQTTITFPPPSPPPPPPPPRDPVPVKRGKSEKKRGGATKEFLISLRKNKKRRQKSVENLDSFFNLEAALPMPSPSLPPPPTPPPPCHNMFPSKKFKDKRPPLEARPLVTTRKASLPVRLTSLINANETIDSGNESPVSRIPPLPPLPPFKMPALKFEVHGDFVRLKSFKSSRSGSPDSDDDASIQSSSGSGGEMDAGDLSSTLFCQSPDVNTKADKFIERFRAGLKLEKVNSVKAKQQSNGRSNLGPGRVRQLDPDT